MALKFQELLRGIGLGELEAKVYDTLLEVGEAPVRAIIKKTGLKRPTAYHILRELVKKGLAIEVKMKKFKGFRPGPPDALLRLLASSESDLSRAKKLLSLALPDLFSQYRLAINRPHVVTYEGVEGIKKVYIDTIEQNPGKQIAVFRSYLDDRVLGIKFFEKYVKERAQKDIETKIISPAPVSHKKEEEDRQLKKKRKFWKEFKIPAEIDIYGDKIAIISYEEPLMGTIIENKAIAETLRTIFQELWVTL